MLKKTATSSCFASLNTDGQRHPGRTLSQLTSRVTGLAAGDRGWGWGCGEAAHGWTPVLLAKGLCPGIGCCPRQVLALGGQVLTRKQQLLRTLQLP